MDKETPIEKIHPALITNEKMPPFPIGDLLGFRLIEIKEGISRVSFTAEARYANPMGTLHGGVLADITDAAMGMVVISTLKEGESFTTLEMKINFLRPFRTGSLIAEGKVINKGQTIVLVEAEVLDEKNRLIARANSTCMILKGEMARGR